MNDIPLNIINRNWRHKKAGGIEENFLRVGNVSETPEIKKGISCGDSRKFICEEDLGLSGRINTHLGAVAVLSLKFYNAVNH